MTSTTQWQAQHKRQ